MFLLVIEETDKIMKLQYRTRRRGFHFYVQGQVLGLVKALTILNAIYFDIPQIKELSKLLFMKAGRMTDKVDAKLKKQEIVFDTAVFHFELEFDNQGYQKYLEELASRTEASMPIRATVLFEMFPFCILYEVNRNMRN